MENVQEKSLFDDLVSADEPTPVFEQIENEAVEEVNDVSEDDVEVPEPNAGFVETEEPSNENAEEVDDRVEALYELLLENQIVAKNDGFKPTVENLQGVIESLPEQYFLQAAESLHPDARDIAKSLFYLGENATKDEIVKLLSDTPSTNIDDEDSAYTYLESKLKGTAGFKDESRLAKYLQTLKDDDSLVDTAKEMFEEDVENAEQNKQQRLEQLKQQKVEREQQVKQFYKNINTELKNLPWQQDKKQQIVQHLQPAKVEEINAMIQSSPMAVIQLADIYSRFNPETKQFDLSDFELKQESKKNLDMKDNAKKAKLDSILSKVKSGKNNVASSQQSGFFNQFEKTN